MQYIYVCVCVFGCVCVFTLPQTLLTIDVYHEAVNTQIFTRIIHFARSAHSYTYRHKQALHKPYLSMHISGHRPQMIFGKKKYKSEDILEQYSGAN